MQGGCSAIRAVFARRRGASRHFTGTEKGNSETERRSHIVAWTLPLAVPRLWTNGSIAHESAMACTQMRYREISRYEREKLIAKLTEIQQSAGQLLAQLEASEHDAFAAHSTGRAGNTGQLANVPEKAASKSNGA